MDLFLRFIFHIFPPTFGGPHSAPGRAPTFRDPDVGNPSFSPLQSHVSAVSLPRVTRHDVIAGWSGIWDGLC